MTLLPVSPKHLENKLTKRGSSILQFKAYFELSDRRLSLLNKAQVVLCNFFILQLSLRLSLAIKKKGICKKKKNQYGNKGTSFLLQKYLLNRTFLLQSHRIAHLNSKSITEMLTKFYSFSFQWFFLELLFNYRKLLHLASEYFFLVDLNLTHGNNLYQK